MARPQKEGMDYFPHDVDACSDEKVEALMMIHESAGYAFYFILLERIYRSKDFELDISDAETIQILSRKMSITVQKFNEILKTALKHRCFDVDYYEKTSKLTSEGIKKRAKVVVDKRESTREKYVRVDKNISDAETIQKYDSNMTENMEETLQRKEKKRREELYTTEINSAIDYLNLKCGTKYKKDTDKTRSHLNARFSEGYTLEDIKKVIDKKESEWSGNMRKYLRPETLFGTKFENYTNEFSVENESMNPLYVAGERLEGGAFRA